MAKEEVRKHFRLAELLRDEILDLPPHDPFPGERALAERYGTSRVTIRQALALLQDDGQIYTVHGAGSFVAPTRAMKQMKLLSFTDEMKQRGFDAVTQLLSAELISPDQDTPDDFMVMSEPSYRIERLRLAGQEPLSLEITYITEQSAPGLLKEDLTKSLYKILAFKYGQEITSADEHLTPIVLGDEESQLLKVPAGTAALRIQRTGYNVRGEEVERSLAVRQGSRWDFKYSIRN
jgi:GntR family transcriptional regulator